MNDMTFYILLYIAVSSLIAYGYVYLYNKHFMPSVVKTAPKFKQMGVYATLFITMVVLAPYALYAMIKTKNNGGFNK